MKSNQILHAYNCISIPRSKKGIKSLPDLKASTFKVFRGLDLETIHQLLTDVDNSAISIKEATTQYADIKALQKIQQGFMRVMNVSSWDEAKEMYPQHTTSEKLEPFKHLNFSGHRLPQQFLQFASTLGPLKALRHQQKTLIRFLLSKVELLRFFGRLILPMSQ